MTPIVAPRYAVAEEDLLELWAQPRALPLLAAACDGAVEGRVVTIAGVPAVVLDGAFPEAVAAGLCSLRLPSGALPRLYVRQDIGGPWARLRAAPAVLAPPSVQPPRVPRASCRREDIETSACRGGGRNVTGSGPGTAAPLVFARGQVLESRIRARRGG